MWVNLCQGRPTSGITAKRRRKRKRRETWDKMGKTIPLPCRSVFFFFLPNCGFKLCNR